MVCQARGLIRCKPLQYMARAVRSTLAAQAVNGAAVTSRGCADVADVAHGRPSLVLQRGGAGCGPGGMPRQGGGCRARDSFRARSSRGPENELRENRLIRLKPCGIQNTGYLDLSKRVTLMKLWNVFAIRKLLRIQLFVCDCTGLYFVVTNPKSDVLRPCRPSLRHPSRSRRGSRCASGAFGFWRKSVANLGARLRIRPREPGGALVGSHDEAADASVLGASQRVPGEELAMA